MKKLLIASLLSILTLAIIFSAQKSVLAADAFGPFVNFKDQSDQSNNLPRTGSQSPYIKIEFIPYDDTYCYTGLNTDLRLGSRGSEVKALQDFLIKRKYLASRFATGYFGTNTQAALKSYQMKVVAPNMKIKPAIKYGQLDKFTRDYLNNTACLE